MPKIVDKEAKRMELIHAAMIVYAEKGAEQAKMQEIAAAAGVGKGTLYEYFSSKGELFTAVFYVWIEEMEKVIGQQLAEIDDPREKLTTFFRANVDLFEHTGDMAIVLMDFWAKTLRDPDSPVFADFRKMYTDYMTMVTGIFQQGIDEGVFRQVDTAGLAATMLAMLDGLVFQYILKPDDKPLIEKADALLEVVLAGLTPETV